MSNWITIWTFAYPHEAHFAKTKLESEGIAVFIKDELSAQVYSVAVGGLKLQVPEDDIERANQILMESGYIQKEEKRENKLITRLDHFTSKFPLIGKSVLEFRLLILTAIILVLIIVPAVLFSMPSMKNLLTGNRWCIDKIYRNGKEVQPHSYGLKIFTDNDCTETMYFNKDGIVDFPGINSYGVNASWELINRKLSISKKTTQNNNNNNFSKDSLRLEESSGKSEAIFYGIYTVKIKNSTILLQSDSVTIYGHKERPTW